MESVELRGKTVSTLLDQDCFSSTDDTLEHYVVKNSSVHWFMRIVGLIWSSEGVPIPLTVQQYVWNIFVRGSLLLILVWGILAPIVLSRGGGIPIKVQALFVVLGITLILQSCTMLWAFGDMRKRLNSKVSRLYLLNLSKGLNSAYLVLVSSVTISIIPLSIGMYFYGDIALYVCYLIPEVAVSLVLAATTYFISTDCVVAISLLDQLIEQQKLQTLTFDQFAAARKEVNERQQSSVWINNSIVLVALLDMCTILLFIFVNLLASGQTYILMFAIFVKEIPYLFVVYWQVAQVNEKSALLMKNLSSHRWNVESHSDHERVAIYVTAQGNPIVMSLAGMKLKRRDLAWQFALWCFAFLVSIVKAAVASEV